MDNPTAIDTTDGLFKIRGALTLTSPNGAESWNVAAIQNITWTRFGSIANVKLEYSTNSGTTYPNLITASTDASALSYSWTIPDNLATTIKVKVTDTADASVWDQSNADFTIKGALTVIAPNGGEDLLVSSAYNITWVRFGSIANVKLEYSTNGGITYPNLIIAATDAAAQSYAWAVPDLISTTLRVQATDVDNALVFDRSDANFTIKGVLQITAPNGGEIWFVNGSQNITWTRTGSIANAKIEYSTDGGTTYPNIITATVDASLGTYAWTVADAISSQIKIRITDTSNATVNDESDANLSIKGKLVLNVPNGGQLWIVGESRSITWTRTGSIANAKLDYSTDSGTSYPNAIIASTDAATGTYAWTVGDAIGTNVRVRVSDASDGTVNDASDADFEIKGSLTVTAPNGGESWVVGSINNITWTKQGTIANLELRYSLNGGTSYDTVIIASTPGAALSYAWTVPDSINATVKVKITDISDLAVYDVSNANFKIIGAFVLTAPNGAEEWVVGTSENITWTVSGSITNAKLDYSINSGATYSNAIIGSTGAAGLSYSWTIPNSVNKTIRVKIADAADVNVFDVSNADFTIMPKFAITSPNGGEVWEVASSQDLTWLTTGDCANVKLEYSVNSGSTYTDIIATTPNTEIYGWTIPDNLSIACKIRISDVDNPTALDTTDGLFKIRGQLTLISPNGFESWNVAAINNITWTRFGSISNVKLEYSTNSGTTYPNLIIASTDASALSYAWTIPDNLATTIKVKITDTADASVWDASDADFTIKGALTMIYPNGAEQFEVGIAETIIWNRFGSIQNVKLEYSTDSGTTYPNLIIAATGAGSESYAWSPADNLSQTVRVKVSDVDNALVFDTSNANFTIKGNLRVGVPNGGEVWFVGEVRNITWTRNGSIPTIKLEYSTDSGVTYPNMIAPSEDASTLTYNWSVPDALGTVIRVKITDISNATVTDTSNADFTIKGTLTLLTPNGGESWIVSSVHNITWNRTGSIPNIKIEYSTNGGSTYPNLVIASTDAGTGTYAWTVPDAIGTQLRVRISQTTDASVNDISNANFVIKGALLLTAPNGAEAWGIGTSRNITWTRTGSIANVVLAYSLDGGVSFPTTIVASTDGSTGSYSWTIPDNPNSTVKVRVADILDATVLDISDTNFKIIGSLNLTQPDGTEQWGVGESRKISWTMVGSIANVKLEYSINSGASYDYLIIASTPAGGLEYYWTIPDRTTTTARVKISDASDISVDDRSTADFSIQAIFTIIAPNGGEVWTVADSEDITWSTVGSVANVKLEYSTDGGSTYDNTIVGSVSNTNTYAWAIPDALSSTVRVRISDVNDAQALDTSDANFKIRGDLTLTAPNGGEILIVGASQNITWIRNGSIPIVKLEYSANSGTTYPNSINNSVDASLLTYAWTIPDNIGTQLRVKITYTLDATVYDESNSDFIIKGALNLTVPNGGESWIVGSGENITWSRTGSIANVALDYSMNSGGTYPNPIIASTNAATGTYSWAIPDALSTTLRVRVSNTADASVSDASNANFMIKGSLTLTSPNGGQIWYVGTSQNVTWTMTGSIPAVKLEYSTNSGSSYDSVIIASTAAAAGTYAWSIPDAIGGNSRVKVTDTANATVYDESDADFTIKGVLALNVPNGGEEWIVGAAQNITWTPTGTITNVKLEYSTDGGNTYPNLIIASTGGMSGTYAWTVADAIGTNLKVRVSNISDASVNDTSNAVFKIKGSLVVTTPNGGESWDVASSQNIIWNRTGAIANISIKYSTDGGSSYPNTITASTDAGTGSYAWTIPDDISSQVKVLITDTADATVYDATNVNFKIVGVLNLTSPDGAEEWNVGTNHNITWTRVGSIANVRLDYSINSGTTYPNSISASAPAGALSFTWTIPDAPSTKVRVRAADASDVTVFDTSVADFTIKAGFVITAPNGGEVWTVSSSHDITWTTVGSVTTVILEYSTDGGTTFPNVVTGSAANTGSFPWTIPDSISSQGRVRVSDFANANANDISNANFKIRGSISLTAPNGAESWLVSSANNITWSIVGSIANVKIDYSTDSGSTYPNVITALTNAVSGTYAWTIPDNLTLNARVKVTDATDSTVYDESNADFTIRGGLQLTVPNGAEQWRVNTAENITWLTTGSIQNISMTYSTNGGSTYPSVIAASVNASLGSYPWAIPDAIGNQVRVRITDTANATVYDSSDANFSIKGVLHLDTPNGGEVLEVGSNRNITWTVTGSISNVKLEYSTDNGTTYPNVIVASYNAALATYAWSVPDNLSTQARVKITNLSDPTVYDESDAEFDIIGQLIISAPNGGEVWPVGTSQAISWVTMGSIANVKLELSTNGGVTYPLVITASTSAAIGSYSWTIPDAISIAARIKISDISNPGVVNDTSDANFKIRGNLTLTYPNGGEVLLINDNRNITWTRFGSIVNARIDYSKDGGGTFPYSIIGSVDASLETYSWNVPDDPGTLIRVKIADAADVSVYDVSDGNFIIRGGFSIITPNGGEQWAVNSLHDITWTTFGTITNVRLSYSSNNGSNWTLITATVGNIDLYSWTIPDRISDQCLIRVSDVNDSDANDLSNAVFKINGTLTLTAPNGAEQWGVATAQNITWTMNGTIANVKLEYSINSGATYPNLIITSAAGALLNYVWTIPDEIYTTLRVRVSDVLDSNVYDTSDADFKIKADFTLVTPNGGETWVVNSSETISWTSSGTVPNIRLDYSANAGSSWIVISLSIANTGSYVWTVPDAISDQCMIKVANAADTSAYDESNNNFKICGDLILTVPNGGETWAVGAVKVITWNRVGSIANVLVEYSDNGGTNFVPIIASTPNTGSYAWTVPDSITTQALVRITNLSDLTVTDTSSAVFKIQGSFTITSPNGGEAWMVASNQNINWTWNGTLPFVKLEYSSNSGSTYNLIADNVPNVGTYSWSIPDAVAGTCRIRVSDTNDSQANDTSNGDFRIRCGFTLSAPNGAEQWKVGSVKNITWASVGTAPTVNLQYSRDDFLTDNQTIVSDQANVGSYAWTIPDSISDNVKVKVRDSNDIGAFDISNAVFRITGDFTVTAPNGGEMWNVNDIENITWTWLGTMAQVRIEYSTDGGASYPNIVSATNNDGVYEWLVPDTITAQLRVRISDLADSTAYDTSDGNAKIRAFFTILTPNGLEIMTVNNSYGITWNTVGTVANVDLHYSTDDFLTVNGIVGSTPNDGAHTWTVPDSISTTVKVRVKSSIDSDAYDISNANFKIRGAFTVTSPNGGELWAINQVKNITWNTIGTIANVRILYSTNSGAAYLNTVTNSAVNTETYAWTVPDTATATARIRVLDAADATVYDDSDADFRMQGFFALNAPNGGEYWIVGSSHNITWTWGGTLASAKLSYSTDSGITYPNVINAAAPNGAGSGGTFNYAWTLPDNISITVKVKVEDPNDNTVFDVSDDDLTIAGQIIITSPNGGERWITRESHAITWTTAGTVPTIDIKYSKDNFGSNIITIVSGQVNTNSYAWSVPDDRSATVKVRVIDPRDPTNTYDDSNANFTIDYYTVSFVIRDLITNEELSTLSVDASSNLGDIWATATMPGNAAAPLGSPVTVALPAGLWTAVWSKVSYGDKQATFEVNTDKALDTLFMETTVIHIWRAYSEVTYEATNDVLKIASWLERDGYAVSGADTVTIEVYDDDGNLVHTLFSDTPNAAGFFNLKWNAPTGLLPSVVYTVITKITNASGAEFKTPTSFNITETQQLVATQEAMESMRDVTLPAFQSGVEATINAGIAEQKTLIDTKMTEQTNIIDTKTTEMRESVDASMSAFETRSQVAIDQLQEGADQATQAGAELETIAKRQSGELILPTTVLTGGTVNIRFRIASGLMPLMDVISFDGTMLRNQQPLIESTSVRGLYGYDLYIDGTQFKPGKAFTVVVTENTTGNLQAGSVMVESTSLTSIEGLASSIPQVKSIADQTLQAVDALQNTLATGGDLGRALSALQNSVDELPTLLTKEGPSGKMAEDINALMERLKAFAGDEGYDISAMVEDALSNSPTMKEIKSRTESIKSIVNFLQQLFEHKFGGMEEEPMVSTSLSTGSLVVNVVAANPSSTMSQITKVKVYLPKEVTPNDIMDTGGLDVEFDANQSIYYVYKDRIELAPKEVRVFKVEIEDIWIITQTRLDVMKLRATKLASALEKTEYVQDAEKLVEKVYAAANEVIAKQNDIALSREQHIGAYRANIQMIDKLKTELNDMEKLMIVNPNEVGALSQSMTWKIIITVILFVGLLAVVFFFTWYRKSGLTQDVLSKAKQFSFPEEEKDDKGEEKK
ncbi:MAG: GPI anchored serine-threonine rich family protein [Candidatus Omnitrophica bacterium]|nr:GPI anchored serine-threonine rich family protein [Candidatus Omnitrophota bacterium]